MTMQEHDEGLCLDQNEVRSPPSQGLGQVGKTQFL